MKSNIIVVDNFYNDVDAVRAFALQQPFDVPGNYPGYRTRPLASDSAKQVIQNIIAQHAGMVTNWHDKDGDSKYTGSFQICTINDKTWIHADIYNTWSAVCFLTPNAPTNSGTCFYKHIKSQQSHYVDNFYDGANYSEWETTDYVANFYNRIVFFRGSMFHAAVNYFGTNLHNGRLFQTFFFDTQF